MLRGMRVRPVVAGLLALAVAGGLDGRARPRPARAPGPILARNPPRAARVTPARPRHSRPPQFVVVSFDGSGGSDMFEYWRAVARRVHAHFTFFVSGVYLIDWAHAKTYHPPRHQPGRSDIGFAPTAEYASGTLEQIVDAYGEGDEIGTHFNGHFCAPFPG